MIFTDISKSLLNIILIFEKLTDTVEPLIPMGVWGKVSPIVSYSGRSCTNRVPFTRFYITSYCFPYTKGKGKLLFYHFKGSLK